MVKSDVAWVVEACSSSKGAGPCPKCAESDSPAFETVGSLCVGNEDLRERSCEEFSTELTASDPIPPPRSCDDTSSVEDSHHGARTFPCPAPGRTRESCEGFEDLRSRDRPVPSVRPRDGDDSSIRDGGGGGVSASRRSGGARDGGAAKIGVVNMIGASPALGDVSAPIRCPPSAVALGLPVPGLPSLFPFR